MLATILACLFLATTVVCGLAAVMLHDQRNRAREALDDLEQAALTCRFMAEQAERKDAEGKADALRFVARRLRSGIAEAHGYWEAVGWCEIDESGGLDGCDNG